MIKYRKVKVRKDYYRQSDGQIHRKVHSLHNENYRVKREYIEKYRVNRVYTEISSQYGVARGTGGTAAPGARLAANNEKQ